MTQPSLYSECLILRPFTLSDASVVQKLAGERIIADHTNVPHPYENGMAESWIQSHAPKYESGELAAFAIIRKSDGALIGAIDIVIFRESNNGGLGYWLGTPYWNQGYCTEAAQCIIDFGFSTLNLKKIGACHQARNPASGRVLQKVGMNQEEVLREHTNKWGDKEHLVDYSLTKSQHNIKY